MDELNHEHGAAIAPGSNLRAAARGGAITRQDVFMLSPDQLVVDPENVRDGYESEQAREHIENLKRAMMAGHPIPVLEIVAQADDNGRYMIVDGAHRKLAADELQKEGFPYKLRCAAFRGNSTDRIAYMMRSSQGLPLNPVEMARGVLKLANRNMTIKEIAQSLNKSSAWVQNQLSLAEADPSVLQMIRDRKVSASSVLEMMREDPVHYASRLSGLASQVQKAGKKKVTKAVMHGPRVPPKTVDILVESIRGVVQGLDEEVLQKVSDAEIRMKAQELTTEDLQEETVEITMAALLQIVKGSDALRDFEERCAERQERRLQKQALEAQRKAAAMVEHVSNEQIEIFLPEREHDESAIEMVSEGCVMSDPDEQEDDASDEPKGQHVYEFPRPEGHEGSLPMAALGAHG